MSRSKWAGFMARSTRVFALTAIACAAAALPSPKGPVSASTSNASQQGSEPRHIEITARRFSYSPSEITLKKGEPVVLVLTSTDVTHGLVIKDLGVKTEIKKGKATETAEFTPMKVGTFQGKCSHFCGKGHGSMVLTVNVVE